MRKINFMYGSGNEQESSGSPDSETLISDEDAETALNPDDEKYEEETED